MGEPVCVAQQYYPGLSGICSNIIKITCSGKASLPSFFL